MADMKEWFSAAELAAFKLPELPTTKQAMNRLVTSLNWQPCRDRTGRGGGREFHLSCLPDAAKLALLKKLLGKKVFEQREAMEEAAAPMAMREQLWKDFERQTDEQRERALNRLQAIQTALLLIDAGVGREQAFKQAAEQHDYHFTSLYRWYQRIQPMPKSDWAAGLQDRYKGAKPKAEFPADSFDLFKADYLRQERPNATACYHRLQRIATQHSWILPSIDSFERRLKRDVPVQVRLLLREGLEKLMQLHPPAQRTVSDLHALNWINGDGYYHNVFVKWPDGEIGRPKTWVWQDVYSRKILAFRTARSENSDTLRLSFGTVVEQYGIPEHVTLDNTKAAANKWLTGGAPWRQRHKAKDDDPVGILTALGVHVHWTSINNFGGKNKGHGQAKPVERAFGIGGFGEVVDKHPAFAGAWTGNNPTSKPENYGSTAIPIDTFVRVMTDVIRDWNAQKNRRTEMCKGVLSFDETFKFSYEQSPIRKPNDEQRKLWLLMPEKVTLRKDGSFELKAGANALTGDKNRYHTPELLAFGGEAAVARFDPEELHGPVCVYNLEGRYLATANIIHAVGFGDTSASRDLSRERNRMVRATKEAAKAEQRMHAFDVAARLPHTEAEKVLQAGASKIGRTKFGRAAPQQRELRADEQAELNAMRSAQVVALPVVTREEEEQRASMRARYERWLRIDARVTQGEHCDDSDMKFWSLFQQTPEFAAAMTVWGNNEGNSVNG